MTKTDWHRAAAITVTIFGVIVSLYLVGRYALALFCPFLIAFALALLTRPIVLWLSRRTNCPRRIIAALITLLTLLILGALFYTLCSRLLIELQKLFVFLIEDSAEPNGQIARFIGVVKGFFQRIPFVEKLQRADILQYFVGDTEAFVCEEIHKVISRFSERVAGALGALLRGLPSLLLFVLVTVISCFYFAIEFEAVCRALTRLVPRRFADRVPALRARAAEAARRYFRAYFLLFLLTFAQLTVGLIILRVDYVFLIAFLTAVLDILPVLGVGTVLVPFALFSFATGNMFRGVGLLILYGVMTVVRQIAEPHLVGKSLGLHPILMLVSFYAGFKLFGVAGVFLGPALALLIKALLGSKETEQSGK